MPDPLKRRPTIQKEVRQAIEQGIAENVEELALRGKPKGPFYMVGNIGGQNVVLRAEHGQVKITVNDQPGECRLDTQPPTRYTRPHDGL
jgi:hypothetical protein